MKHTANDWPPPGSPKSVMILLITITTATLFFVSPGTLRSEEQPKIIDGYGGYKFGMTMEQASAVREDAKWEERDYGDSRKKKALTRNTTIFGERGTVIVGFNKDKLVDRIIIHFERFDGACNDKLLKTIYGGLKDSYGVKYLKAVPRSESTFPTVRWLFPQGGKIELVNLCIWGDDDDFKSDRPQGLIIVTYAPAEGF